MNVFRNASIGKRLGFGFGLVLLLLAVMSVVATLQMARLADNTAYFAVNLVPSYESEHKLALALSNIRRAEFRHILSSTSAEMDALESRIADERKLMMAEFDRYAKDLVSDDEDKRSLGEARAAFEGYMAAWEKVRTISRLTLTDPSKTEQANQLAIGPSGDAYRAADQAIQKWWDYNVKLAAAQTVTSSATYANAKVTALALTSVSLVLGVLAAIWIARSITQPIGQAVQAARAVAAGDLSVRVEVTSTDEAG